MLPVDLDERTFPNAAGTLASCLDTLERGDLVWQGHVAIMTDGYLLLHANAHHMSVVIEPLKGAADRIARTTSSCIVAVKRPASKTA